MGSLRFVPKQMEPGFIKFRLDNQGPAEILPEATYSNLSIKTRQGTEIRVGRELPLKQVARLVRMLEGRS